MNARRQIVISAIAAVFVTVLFFFVVLTPKLNEISEARAETQEAIDRESTLTTELARLQELQKQGPQTQAKLAKLRTYLPTVPDLPGFIRQVQAAATAAGIDLSSIAPTQPVELENGQGVQTINATLTVSAGFRRMEDFLVRLENLQRVVEIRTLALSPVEDEISGTIVLDGTVSLTMYVVADSAAVTTRTVARTTPTPAAGGS